MSRKRIASIAFLVFGLAVAFYLSSRAPREQHLRIVLGAAAPEVSGVALRYLGQDGETLREASFSFASGAAPRVVSHEPSLPDGDYRVEIDVDARDGRRTLQRRVTLGGGSTQIDLGSSLTREERRP